MGFETGNPLVAKTELGSPLLSPPGAYGDSKIAMLLDVGSVRPSAPNGLFDGLIWPKAG